MDRVPLKEKNTGNISASSSRDKPRLTETPNTHKSRKITTPPESVLVSRKKSSILETPISKHFNDEGLNTTANGESDNTKSALLSPAFSSPQQQNHRRVKENFDIPPKPSFLQSSSASLDSDDEKYKTKKKKKSKKDLKDTPFHLGSHDKPPYSYATLIGMSILSNAEKKLTLSQIYQWISDTFKYYRREEVGWQNSIRHNLSLNKAFIKGEKSKDGKGHFWCIQPGCEEQFLRSKNSKKHSYQEIIDQIYASIRPPKSSINSIPSSPTVSHEDLKRKASDTDDAASYNTYGDDEDQEDEEYTRSILDPPTKKQRLLSATTGNGTLESIPNLEAPFSQWQATPNGFKISNSPNSSHSNNPPQFVVSESPDKPLLAGKNLTFTSSFSCNSNLELSPIRPSETGPLLEPLTPANNIYKTGSLLNHQLSAFHYQSHHPHLSSSTTSTLLQQSIQQPYNVKTPKSCSRTPLRNSRTPQTTSIMKKLWNSPSYLEEFYYSPLISSSHAALNSYDDDDMIMRAFELPSNSQNHNKRPSISSISTNSSRNLFNDLKNIDHLSRNTSTSSNNDKDRTRLRNVSTSSTEQGGN